MDEVLNVLCLEDSPKDAEIIHELLIDAGFNLKMDSASTEKEFVSFLKSRRYNIILSDFKLPGFDAFSALIHSKNICPDVPFICVSGTVGEETAIELLKKGAVDYILKDRLIRLPAAIQRAIEEAKEKEKRREAEVALYESEERFRTLYENSTVGIYRTTPDGKILLANPALVKMLGFLSFEDLSIRNLEDAGFEPSYERAHFKDIMRKEGQVNGMEAAWCRTDGTTLFVSESARSIKNNNGDILYYDGIVEDITTRKKAEEIKLESEARYASLFNNMLNGYAYCKMLYKGNYAYDFIYLEVNNAFESLTGLKNVKGKRVSEVIPNIRQTDNELFEIYSRVSLTGKPEVFENYVESLKMWFSISVYSPGKEYFVAVFDVITQRKLAEEKIKDLAKFPSENPDPVLRVDKEGILLYANEACNKLLTWKLITGSKIPGTLHREIKSVFKTGLKKIIDTEHFKRLFSFNIVPSIEAGYCNIYAHDITERKLAEEALRESEDKFKYVFDHSVIGKSITFPSGEMHVNKSFCDMIGYSQKELENVRWQDISHPDDINLTEKELKNLISGKKKSTRFIKRYIHKNGSVIWTDVGTALRRDPDGSPLYFMTAAIDITERKLAEVALQESEERFSKSFRTSPISFMIANMEDGGIIEINDAFTGISGFSREEAIGNTTLEMKIWVHEEDRKYMIDSLREGKPILHKETVLRGKEGNEAIVLLSAQVIKLANRNCIISSIEDITERKHAEEALRGSEQRFRSMANSIPQLAWVARADGFIYWYNQQWYKYTGTKPEQMEGWGWQIVHDPEVLPKVMEKWTGSIASGQPFEMSFPLRGVDGKFRTFLTRVEPWKDSDGKVLQWFGTNTDVDTLKQAEEKIRLMNKELDQRVIERTANLEAANKELEAFSYSVSHDLRAPLRAIHGYTKILMEDYHSTLDDEGKRICDVISSSATKMGELIDDLLNFSRVGRSAISPSVLDMKKMAVVIFEGMTSPIQRERIKFKVGKLCKSCGDIKLIGQVWTNLLSNAIKYTSKNHVSEIVIGSSISDKMVTYFIKDNGVGFDMQYAHKLFGVFQRLHSESEFEGNGVGLAIVQRIILKHGGKVWAEGKEWNGATFFFSLPANGVEKVKRQKIASLRSQ